MPRIEYDCNICDNRKTCTFKPTSKVVVLHGGGATCFKVEEDINEKA